MARTSRTRRFIVLSASTALAAGGVLLPTSAFAATDSHHAVTAKSAPQGDHWRHGNRGGGGGGGQSTGRGNVIIIFGNGNTVPINNGTVNNR
ncbi:hypothetical protein [Streptomyces sp. NPDC059828]|uniref:hypothetical protein n=1 Tax=Streptomyces sp. NPDC059828 TaxID=3346965 RepID=UPI00365BF0C1